MLPWPRAGWSAEGIVAPATAWSPFSIPQDPLRTLRQSHPRVLITAFDIERIQQALTANPEVRRWLAGLQAEAEALRSAPPHAKDVPLPPYNLIKSQRLLHRVQLLGLLYLLTKDPRPAHDLWPELLAAIQAPDWRPGHFLTTAEVTSALGLAYDWLHGAWTPEQRTLLQKAITEKGLHPGLAAY